MAKPSSGSQKAPSNPTDLITLQHFLNKCLIASNPAATWNTGGLSQAGLWLRESYAEY
jgi:hypothetical protein